MPKLTLNPNPFHHHHLHLHLHLHSLFFYNVSLSLSNPPLQLKPAHHRTQMAYSTLNHHHHRDKVLVIMGGTGTGKSKLSVDLASRFSGEIINSDKIQVYRGLDITTNKMTPRERRGVPHHLLGELDPDDPEFTPAEFRSVGARIISGIISRRRLPIIAGGSNSFVHALLAERFDPENDVFTESGLVCSELRYDCCFLWVDVAMPVLFDYLSKRVDEMLDSGMFEELERYFDSKESRSHTGLRKAIGVPEFDSYFRKRKIKANGNGEEREREEDYEEAVREIKENTCQLVKRQLGKILRLRGAGWVLHRLDATASFKERLTPSSNGELWREIWKREMIEPSVKIVKRFLEE